MYFNILHMVNIWYAMVSLFQNTLDYHGFIGISWYFTMVYLFQNTIYHGMRRYIFIKVSRCWCDIGNDEDWVLYGIKTAPPVGSCRTTGWMSLACACIAVACDNW